MWSRLPPRPTVPRPIPRDAGRLLERPGARPRLRDAVGGEGRNTRSARAAAARECVTSTQAAPSLPPAPRAGRSRARRSPGQVAGRLVGEDQPPAGAPARARSRRAAAGRQSCWCSRSAGRRGRPRPVWRAPAPRPGAAAAAAAARHCGNTERCRYVEGLEDKPAGTSAALRRPARPASSTPSACHRAAVDRVQAGDAVQQWVDFADAGFATMATNLAGRDLQVDAGEDRRPA